MSDRPCSPGWPDGETIRDAFHYLLEAQPRADLNRAHAAVLRRYARRQDRLRRWRWFAAAAVVAALVIFPLSTRTSAVPALVSRFEESWVGGTLRNVRAYFSRGAEAQLPPPALRGVPNPVTRKFADIRAAQEAAGFPILVPGWLPPGARFKEAALLTSPWGETRQVELWYTLPDGYVTVSESRLQEQAAEGSLYDTDDAQTSQVSVGGAPGTLVVHKSGYVRVNWAIPGYVLSVNGIVDANSALRVAASLHPAPYPAP